MGKVVVIAEKPSVARDIARVLKCTGKGNGFLFSDKYIVTWAVGHLVSLFDPEDYDSKYKRWSLGLLPILPESIRLKPIDKTKDQLNILKKLINDKDTESLICATDSGREGELIFRYIYDICKCDKPFKRLWISSMTDSAIKEGFNNLADGESYNNLYLSAKCRSEADWLVGINASRVFTTKYKALLSIGRVQTPTLAILVEKQKEINSFVSKDYWEVTAGFQEYTGLWFEPETNDSKIPDKEKAYSISEKVLNQEGRVEQITKEQKKQPPPLLYDLTDLQRDCNRRFGFSAKKTLELAQLLYERRKLITYPRTDSRYLSKDMAEKLPVILEKLQLEPSYDGYVSYIKSLPSLPVSKRIIDDSKVSDHHAIIPTESKAGVSALSADEFKVYDLIVRRFLSAFYPHYIYDVTKVVTNVHEERFMTKGATIRQLGYMELYREVDVGNDTKEEKGEDTEQKLPDLTEGDKVTVESADVSQKKTKPPKPYTEGTLLSAMENAGRFVDDESLKEMLKESGLGTPATRASIIERLLQVGYVERKGKTLVPTDKGTRLIEIVPVELKSPETTGKWEKGLSSIAKGKMPEQKFMDSIVRYVMFIVNTAKAQAAVIEFPEEQPKTSKQKFDSLGKCPKCGSGKVFENSKSFYCSEWKGGCKFTIWKDSMLKDGINLDKALVKNLLAAHNAAKDGGSGWVTASKNEYASIEACINNNYAVSIREIRLDSY